MKQITCFVPTALALEFWPIFAVEPFDIIGCQLSSFRLDFYGTSHRNETYWATIQLTRLNFVQSRLRTRVSAKLVNWACPDVYWPSLTNKQFCMITSLINSSEWLHRTIASELLKLFFFFTFWIWLLSTYGT